MGWMPTDSKTRFAMGLPTMEESTGQSEREDKSEKQKSAEYTEAKIAEARNASAERIAEMQIEAAERQRSGYNQGGAVYKHAHPTYTKFGKTGDSSLLAKGRK